MLKRSVWCRHIVVLTPHQAHNYSRDKTFRKCAILDYDACTGWLPIITIEKTSNSALSPWEMVYTNFMPVYFSSSKHLIFFFLNQVSADHYMRHEYSCLRTVDTPHSKRRKVKQGIKQRSRAAGSWCSLPIMGHLPRAPTTALPCLPELKVVHIYIFNHRFLTPKFFPPGSVIVQHRLDENKSTNKGKSLDVKSWETGEISLWKMRSMGGLILNHS